MRPDIYIENSIISYLAARPSRNLVTAARQQITSDWRHSRRPQFDLYVSELVFTEAADGDPEAASRRMHYLADVEEVPVTLEARSLARALLEEGALPPKAVADALHVATAAVHGIKYLLTWNCAHLANAEIRPLVRSVCAVHGYTSPEICTPEELMGEEPNE
ncbi:MAG: type II toxin-antitoxin system VapC family toxin [Planctomycetes bacterium]|nr:type II toxin-antitoxin system VapC family toxin [Planctomycetota bacterium]